MTIRSSITMLAAMLAVLTLASSASAECAWVLWSARWAQDWVIHGTSNDKEACLRQMSAFTVRRLTDSERAAGNAQLGPRDSGFVVHCLPDTVDPRGPKEAAR